MDRNKLDALQHAFNEALRAAQRDKELDDLSGEEPEGPSGYRQLVRVLRRCLRDTRAMETHRHQWDNDSGFCAICGADGNA